MHVTLINSRILFTTLLQLSKDEEKHITQGWSLIYRRKKRGLRPFSQSKQIKNFEVQIIVANSNILAEGNFTENIMIFEFQKQQLDGRSLQKTNIKPCKIKCLCQLNIRHGEKESAVEFIWTLDQTVLIYEKLRGIKRQKKSNIKGFFSSAHNLTGDCN
jgi:hypothetical protein